MRKELAHFLNKKSKEVPFYFLTADVGYGLFTSLIENIGKRYLNIGIAESNMISIAAGIANSDTKVFTYSIGPFTCLKGLEQIKIDLCYHNSNVCMLVGGVGYHYGAQGITHHLLEDTSMLLNYSNLLVLNPANLVELNFCLEHVLNYDGPSYLRVNNMTGPLHDDNSSYHYIENLRADKFFQLTKGNKLTVITTGTILYNIKQAHIDGIQIISCPVLNIINVKKLIKTISSNRIIVIEESTSASALGNIISQNLLKSNLQVDFFDIITYNEIFPTTLGDEEYLRKINNFDISSLKNLFNGLII